MAAGYGISYPTVRLRLDRLIAKITVTDGHDMQSDFERLLRTHHAEGRSMRTRSNHCLRRIDWRSKTATRALLVPLSLTLVAIGIVPAHAASREFKWNELQKQGNVRAGTVLPPEPGAPFHRLMIRGVPSGPTRVTVLTIDRPQITSPRYNLRGQIQYKMVEGIGYLELWNHFPGGGRVLFSRTLAKEGPMMELHG